MHWLPSEFVSWTSLRSRLTAWNTLVVLAMTVATLLAARFAARATLYADADAELRAGAREVALALEDAQTDVAAVVAELRRKAASHEWRGWFIHLLTEEGTTVWKSDHCPNEVVAFPPRKLNRIENVVQLGPYRFVRLQIPRPEGPAYHVRVGTYTTGLDESLTSLMRSLLIVGGTLLVLTPIAGYWLALRATRPLADILATARQLSPTRMGDRLRIRGTHDELDQLSETVNELLDDVADHVEGQERFVADAAHELRGPLAAIQSSLEVGLAHDDTVDKCHETLAAVLEETRYLSKLSNDLLALAEAGATADHRPNAVVDLTTLVRRSVDMFAGAADERGVTLTLTPSQEVSVAGDPGQLRQVVGNLLDNAIRFTSGGGRVAVEVSIDRSDPPVARLTVWDTGIGIAPGHIPRLFDRFFKVDPARSHGGGHRSGGLGLPICKAIVTRHGGTIEVESRVGVGTTVIARLPLTQPTHPAASPDLRRHALSR